MVQCEYSPYRPAPTVYPVQYGLEVVTFPGVLCVGGKEQGRQRDEGDEP